MGHEKEEEMKTYEDELDSITNSITTPKGVIICTI